LQRQQTEAAPAVLPPQGEHAVDQRPIGEERRGRLGRGGQRSR
jgi:hypothetical protein